eukprot:12135-Heterococcus_DN1.PRE.3
MVVLVLEAAVQMRAHTIGLTSPHNASAVHAYGTGADTQCTHCRCTVYAQNPSTCALTNTDKCYYCYTHTQTEFKHTQELARDYPIGTPGYFGLIIRAFGTLEGLGLSMDPRYSMVKECFLTWQGVC